jgi:hypothetical protein
MVLLARWCAPILSLAMAGAALAQQTAPVSDTDHFREEFGIGHFDAPAIDQVFQGLSALQPIPFDKIWHPLADHIPQDRPHMALLAGNLIADGFLVVAVERRTKIEPVGRGLVRVAKALGIGERLNKRGRHVMELADKERWAEIRHELAKTQAEAEAALLGLKDDDLVQLVALGGWLRGLEMTSATVADNYSPERAGKLFQPQLADLFLERIHDFHPRLRNSPLMQGIEKDLRGILEVIGNKAADAPFSLADVKRIRDLTHEANKASATNDGAGG